MANGNRRYNAVFFKPFPEGYVDPSGKNRRGTFKKIGNGVEKESDGSISVYLDSVPLQWDGSFRLYLEERFQEKQEEDPPF